MEEPEPSIHGETTPTCYLSMRNFNRFVWSDLRLLIVEGVVKEILPKTLKCTKDTILTIEFMGLTLFNNLLNLLGQCSNLCCLIFSNIVLSGHSAEMMASCFPSTMENVQLPQLLRITFNGVGGLTIDETHVLHYLTLQVISPALKTVSFEPRNVTRHRDRHPDNDFVETLNADMDSTTLAKFLVKNSASLKIIQIERSMVSMHHHSPTVTMPTDADSVVVNVNVMSSMGKLDSLQLDEFTCAMGSMGFDQILAAQTQLKVLNCHSNPATNQELTLSHYESVLDSIQRCSKTLTTIRIAHKLTFTGVDEALDNVPEVVHHDCSVYQQCTNLAHLSLSLSLVGEPPLRRRVMRPGSVVNPQFFPESIKTLIIRVDRVEPNDAQLLAGRMAYLKNLGLFLLYGNPETPFHADVSWVSCLVDLPKIQIFELSGCHLENFQSFQNFLTVRQDLVGRLAIATDSCSFWRSR